MEGSIMGMARRHDGPGALPKGGLQAAKIVGCDRFENKKTQPRGRGGG
jgi:hypothetical protein